MCHLHEHKLPLKISVTITRVYRFMLWKACFRKHYIRWDKDERQACRQCNWMDVSWFQRIAIASLETSVLILLMKTNKIWDEGSLFPSLIKGMFDFNASLNLLCPYLNMQSWKMSLRQGCRFQLLTSNTSGNTLHAEIYFCL